MPMFEALKECGTQIDEKKWIIKNDSKGWSFEVYKDAIYPNTETGEESIWDWKINTQLFSNDEYAVKYLKRIIAEKETGIRIINHPKRKVPDICGCEEFLKDHVNDSWGCKLQRTESFSMLCSDCPIAEEIQAKLDGVVLQYSDQELRD